MNALLRFFSNGMSSSTSVRVLTEARILNIILEGLSDECEPIRLAAERDSEISLKKMKLRRETCTPTAPRAVTDRRICTRRDASQL